MYKMYEYIMGHIRRRSLLIRFFLLFLFLIILPLTISTFVNYKYTSDILEVEIHNSNSAMLNNTIKIFDEKISDLKESMLLFTLNYDLNKCANYTMPLSGVEHYEFSRIIPKLRDLVNVKDIIDGVFIYFFKTDYLIANAGRYSSEYFFNNVYKFKNLTVVDWLNELGSIKSFKLTETREVTDTVTSFSRNLITIYAPVIGYAEPSAVLAVSVSESSVSKYLKNINIPESGNIIVFDKENGVISILNKNYNHTLIKNIMDRIRSNKEGNRYFSLDDMIVTYTESHLTGWYYATLIPRSEIFSAINKIKTITLVICLFFIFLGFSLSAFLSNNMYKPIGKIIDAIGGYSGFSRKNTVNSGNEYNFIYQSVYDLKKGNIEVQQSRLLNDVLKGVVTDASLIKTHMQELRMNFDFGNYSVIVCNIDYYKRYMCDFSETERVNMEKNIFDSIYARLAAYASCYTLNKQKNSTVFVIASNDENLKLKIIEALQKTIDIMRRDELYIRISCGIGSAYKNIINLKLSYNEALDAVNLRLLSEGHQIIEYSEVITRKFDIFRQDEQEKTIVNNLLIGNNEYAVSVVNTMVDKNIRNLVPYKYLKNLLFEIAAYYEKATCKKGYFNVLSKEKDIYDEISLLASPEEVKDYFSAIFSKFNEYTRREKLYNNEQLKEAVLSIISERYGEDLYLEKIAKELCVSPTYLCKVFNDQLGMPFTKYLMQVRFVRANELLRTTSLKVADIAKMVGYSNFNSFVRAFRQHEGVTPGSIRKKIINE